MSFSLTLFVVDPDTAHNAIGSKDVRMRRAIGGRFKREMARDDDYFSSQIADGAPTRYEALTAVVDGGPFDEAHGFQYGYAYRMICAFHGRMIVTSNFSPFRAGWLERVDEGLKSLGVTAVRVAEFGYGLPSALPYTDLPGHGVWTAAECATALEQYEAATEDQFAALDREVREAADEAATWLQSARAAQGRGIVGFMS
ncbi:hypothetical protein LO772_03565 [Yinghuangia sp. ASG 101]|uniref:DUF7691 family protein n=1 Tax=Yinghuangia sp. ASG 101 TaxID=2896848 RepID=UPI001E3F4946|nr:hypothetical protein [Yinghuangia sp. ASG 101]UGQ12711.1 hypothetical protein LO772_03565 [Yinghuangia sp. ASG 101]